MYHSDADAVGARNERGELSRASNPCGGFPAELPAGICCQPLLPVPGLFARTKGVERVALPFGVAQRSASSQLLRSRLQVLEMQGAVLYFDLGWVVSFFHPGKIPLTLLSRITLGGLSLLGLLGAGGMSGKQAEGRSIPSCLRHLLPAARGARSPPASHC